MIEIGRAACPYCKTLLTEVDEQRVVINAADGDRRGVAYACANPDCRAVLTVQFDPEHLIGRIVDRVKSLLGKG